MNGVTKIEDSYRFTQGAFYLMGILIFLPHQFFSTCTDYWMYKFRNPIRPPMPPGPPPPPPFNNSDIDPHHYDMPKERNPYQAQITASFNISNAASMAISLILLIFLKDKLPSAHARIKTAMILIFVLFLANTFFTLANTDGERHWFFIVTIILSGLLNHCSALTVMSLYEVITKFPIQYYVAISSGSAITGSISALIQIIARSFRLNPSYGGAIYFSVGTIIILITMVAYWHIEKNSKYFIYRIGSNNTQSDYKLSKNTSRSVVKRVLGKMKWYYTSLVILSGSSALVFPGFLALVVSTRKSIEGEVINDFPDIYFTPVVTFFGYNFSNFLGREIARIIRIPQNWSYVILGSILRSLMVPLFTFCNSMPRHNTPILFGDDAYIAFVIIFGFSEGVLINLSFLAVPSIADEEELEIAVALVPFFIFVTDFVCGAFSVLLILFV